MVHQLRETILTLSDKDNHQVHPRPPGHLLHPHPFQDLYRVQVKASPRVNVLHRRLKNLPRLCVRSSDRISLQDPGEAPLPRSTCLLHRGDSCRQTSKYPAHIHG
uniref:Uncharacterized protein n=1 Tax=Branchiostoma floridae TaxID=7739 RepID=C3YD31_BRAFL|eukprot:XP_002605632.1 hypothetical protein BRAFLDRAFT_128217 [Branchiostoma floridae]